jgi:hypothetical protein
VINKRDFLKSSATAIVASAGATTTLAAVRPSLDGGSGLASWQAHLGQRFEIDGHAVTLAAVDVPASHQPGEQFSLRFSGELPAGLGDGLHAVSQQNGASQTLYLARTPQGLRADFCRIPG